MLQGTFTNPHRPDSFRRRVAYLAALAATPFAARLCMADQTAAPNVIVTRIDGGDLAGRWLGGNSSSARLTTADGEMTLSWDELASITFVGIRASRAAQVEAHFYLADGGQLGGRVLQAGKDAIVAETGVAKELALPIARLAAIRLAAPQDSPRAAELFEQALAERLPGKDVLITRDSDEAKSVQGRLESLGPTEGSFVFADRVRTFQVEKVYGVVFAAGAAERSPARVLVNLVSGESFGGTIENADSSGIRVATSLEASLDVPLGRIANLRFHSERVAYLSDLKPSIENAEGRLHRPWPLRLDLNAAGGPLSIGGRTFERGLGFHSRAEVTYALDGKYESLAATIGIDDVVRPAGSVIFRVLGDGKVLFESELLTGAAPPQDILVGIKGVRQLTLVADYGDELDLSDYADWGGARLLRSKEAVKDSKSS
jgi:hypothetical protein